MTSQGIFQAEVGRLLLAAIVIMGSPGPSTMSAVAVGAAYGFRRAIPYVGGLILGTTCVLVAVAIGVVAVLLSVPHGAAILIAVSSVYILYLALKIATAPPLSAWPDQIAGPALGGGFLLAIANPKAYLALAAVFAGTTILGDDHTRDALLKTALLSVMIVVIHLGWLVAGASLSRALRDPRTSRVVNVTLAVALVATTAIALIH